MEDKFAKLVVSFIIAMIMLRRRLCRQLTCLHNAQFEFNRYSKITSENMASSGLLGSLSNLPVSHATFGHQTLS